MSCTVTTSVTKLYTSDLGGPESHQPPPTDDDLQVTINYRFKHHALLLRAITHRSYRVEHPDEGCDDNETLEFLGDAVLGLVIGSRLFSLYPTMSEGELTKLRSALVQEQHLSQVAQDLSLGKFLRLGRGEDQSGGREKPSILSSSLEALIGAIFVDSDYTSVEGIVASLFNSRIVPLQQGLIAGDPKSALQELTQEQFSVAPCYLLDKAEGPDHNKTFTVSVLLNGQLLATGSAKNKKAAEQRAAAAALVKLRKQP